MQLNNSQLAYTILAQKSHVTSPRQHSAVYREAHFVSRSLCCATTVDHAIVKPNSMARCPLAYQRAWTGPFLSSSLNITVRTFLLSLYEQLPENILSDGLTRVPARLTGAGLFVRCSHRAQMYNCIQAIQRANRWDQGDTISSTLHCT